MKAFFLLFFVLVVNAYRCVNFYGLETDMKNFVCNWQHPPSWYLDDMIKHIKIDSVRLPFSRDYLLDSDMSVMDEFIYECAIRNLDVILDHHRTFEDHQGPSPEENCITQQDWIDALIFVLDRYKDTANVKGISLFNEFQIEDKAVIQLMQIEAVKQLEALFPNRYTYMLGCADWGKDCSDMWLTLPLNNTMIEVHNYYFGKTVFPEIQHKQVFVGEIGFNHSFTNEYVQTRKYLRYHKITNICLWTIAFSKDTENLYNDDCETINNYVKQSFNGLFETALLRCESP